MIYTIVAKMDGIKQMWMLKEPELAGSVIDDDVIRVDPETLKFAAGQHEDGEPILFTVNGHIRRLEAI